MDPPYSHVDLQKMPRNSMNSSLDFDLETKVKVNMVENCIRMSKRESRPFQGV